MERILQRFLSFREKLYPFRFKELYRSHPFIFYWVLFGLFYFYHHYSLGYLKWMHFLFWTFILTLYLISIQTRTFVYLALPFIFKEIVYDFLRFVRFEWLKPIHIADLYFLEKTLFGFYWNGSKILLNEFLLNYRNVFFDFFCSIAYLVHAPFSIILLVFLWRKKTSSVAQRYAIAFLIMNLLAFFTYLIYPAAAPWYVAQYGFAQPTGPISGNPAGLASFDQLIGMPIATNFYSASPSVFGAIPSMHAGFVTLGWLYSRFLKKRYQLVFGAYGIWICFSAVYLQHHYIIDLVWGAFYALFAYFMMEEVWNKRILKRKYGSGSV